jgi:hypothetical protein
MYIYAKEAGEQHRCKCVSYASIVCTYTYMHAYIYTYIYACIRNEDTNICALCVGAPQDLQHSTPQVYNTWQRERIICVYIYIYITLSGMLC